MTPFGARWMPSQPGSDAWHIAHRPKTILLTSSKDAAFVSFISDGVSLIEDASSVSAGVDGANVHHNTIYRPTRWIMRILQENQNSEFVPCRNGRFSNNVVAFRSGEVSSAVNIGAKTDPKSFQFANNFWYCIDRPEKAKRIVHLPTAEAGGAYSHSPEFIDPEHGNLKLHRGSPVRHAGPRSKERHAGRPKTTRSPK